MKENGFKLAKEKSRRYPAQTITDVDYADDVALLANTPNQAESQLHIQERAAGGIGLHVNVDETESKRRHLHAKRWSLKQVDKFTYLGTNVSSTENSINTWLAKVWTAIDRLSVIWKSDLTD